MEGVARRLGPAIAMAVLAHAAVLTQLQAQFAAAPHGQAGGGSRFPFRTRLIQPETPPPAAIAAPSAPAEPAGGAQPQHPIPPAAAMVAAAPAQAPPPARSMPAAGVEAGYVPRGQLTVAPRPLREVDVPFPPDVSGIVDLNVQLSLFIDEGGVVRRVQLDRPEIPPAFARAVAETFQSIPFKPGEIDGVAVRSRIHLEVEFHAPPARQQQGPLSAPGAGGNLAPSLLVPKPPS
ncbi:MAG: TonB family protein [Ramlibacter sp.]|nr:TonB family protein [Ramlibacter sp.]